MPCRDGRDEYSWAAGNAQEDLERLEHCVAREAHLRRLAFYAHRMCEVVMPVDFVTENGDQLAARICAMLRQESEIVAEADFYYNLSAYPELQEFWKEHVEFDKDREKRQKRSLKAAKIARKLMDYCEKYGLDANDYIDY